MAGELVIAGVAVLDSHAMSKSEAEHFVKLLGTALRARGYGMEHYQHYGRALADLQRYCAQCTAQDKMPDNSFEQCCVNFLDTPLKEAADRMTCAATWDNVAGYIEKSELEVAMPVMPLHLLLLSQLPYARQGEFWCTYWTQMRAEGAHIRALSLNKSIGDAQALPVESQTELVETPPVVSAPVDTGDSLEEIVFGELVPTEPDQSQPVTSQTQQAPVPGSGPNFDRTDLGKAAVLRIVRICGAGWEETLRSPFRVPDAAVIAWAQQSEEQIEQISRIILGDYAANSIDKAIKFVKDSVTDRSKIFDLKRKCVAANGRFVFDSDDGFHIAITRTSRAEPREDIEV